MTALPTLDPSRAHGLVARFAALPVLVAGDVMLDRFIVGDVTRISPEAPVPVVRHRTDYIRLGGAANVAHNIAALGGRASLVGVTGDDAAGEQLRERLAAAGIDVAGIVASAGRVTTEKVRVVTERNQQVARIDYENDAPVEEHLARMIAERIERVASRAGAVLVSDYLKGSITAPVMDAITAAARRHSAPLVVDPKIPHLDLYRGAAVVTPNHHEAEAALHRAIRTDDDARAAGRDLRARIGCEAVLITRGEHGMWLSAPGHEGSIPAVAREVADVTGAGDTVAAMLALGLAAGATLAEAAWLANFAASIVVGKFGAATVTVEELLSGITLKSEV